MRTAAVVPAHDSRTWLATCLPALEAEGFDELWVVDDGSSDDTAGWLAEAHPAVRVVATAPGGPHGFAAAANTGLRAASAAEAVALVNADVVLRPGWLTAMRAALEQDPRCGSVAGKLVSLADPEVVDDAGDVLRRDGVCEQRGRGRRDAGRWDAPGEIWGACAGAALYRAGAVAAVGGFDERYRNYLEDVDLALALRSAGWRSAYVPAVAWHAGGASAEGLPAPVRFWTARNTLLLVAKWFPARWAVPVAYRQLSWLAEAARDGALAVHLRGLAAGARVAGGVVRGRAARRAASRVPIAEAVPARPWRGRRAGGHPLGRE